MNPTAFSINGFEIRWYGILIWLGIVAALTLGYYNCKRKNLNFDTVFDGLLVCLPAALIILTAKVHAVKGFGGK